MMSMILECCCWHHVSVDARLAAPYKVPCYAVDVSAAERGDYDYKFEQTRAGVNPALGGRAWNTEPRGNLRWYSKLYIYRVDNV